MLNKKPGILTYCAGFLLLLLPVTDVLAGPGKNKDRDFGRSKADLHDQITRDDANRIIKDSETAGGFIIADTARDTLKSYLRQEYAPDCPPGLAKKNTGCLPPDLYRKRYRVGAALPPFVARSALPESLLNRLGRPPEGYRFAQVDKDILLISEATGKVVDAVTLLSAVD